MKINIKIILIICLAISFCLVKALHSSAQQDDCIKIGGTIQNPICGGICISSDQTCGQKYAGMINNMNYYTCGCIDKEEPGPEGPVCGNGMVEVGEDCDESSPHEQYCNCIGCICLITLELELEFAGCTSTGCRIKPPEGCNSNEIEMDNTLTLNTACCCEKPIWDRPSPPNNPAIWPNVQPAGPNP